MTELPRVRADDILAFWFGRPDEPGFGENRELWFRGGPDVDETLRRLFLADHETAAAGGCAHWREEAEGCLAAILLLDQFPRNMFRGTGRAFATDALARAVARHAIDAGHTAGRPHFELQFFYLPFEHSEELADQDLCLALFEAIPEHALKERWIASVVEHRDIIARFGRFPHRNAILGRPSTPEELAFLAENDKRFGTDPARRAAEVAAARATSG